MYDVFPFKGTSSKSRKLRDNAIPMLNLPTDVKSNTKVSTSTINCRNRMETKIIKQVNNELNMFTFCPCLLDNMINILKNNLLFIIMKLFYLFDKKYNLFLHFSHCLWLLVSYYRPMMR